jgi:hypothetical protein
MKFLPIIGALLLSTAPVQAFETLEELDKACQASEEAFKLCTGPAYHFSAIAGFSLLCKLREQGVITPEEFAAEYNAVLAGPNPDTKYLKVMWNSGIKAVLEDYPNCPIKPVP